MTEEHKRFIRNYHPAFNPRYNGGNQRYHERSIYIPHVGVKQVRKARERSAGK